jgi:hypothetical protein
MLKKFSKNLKIVPFLTSSKRVPTDQLLSKQYCRAKPKGRISEENDLEKRVSFVPLKKSLIPQIVIPNYIEITIWRKEILFTIQKTHFSGARSFSSEIRPFGLARQNRFLFLIVTYHSAKFHQNCDNSAAYIVNEHTYLHNYIFISIANLASKVWMYFSTVNLTAKWRVE